MRHLLRPIVASGLVAALAACGSSGSAAASSAATSSTPAPTTTAPAAACGAEVKEPLDPNEGHVLPGATEPTYLTDPPTSGPHRPGAAPSGVLAGPLDRPSQVGALEGGLVLLQYRDPADLAALTPLATGKVVVAPNAGLPAPVVVTAWLTKLTCTRPDAAAIGAFAAAHGGQGPG